MVSREDSEQGLGPRGITLPTQEREKLASGMASALVHPSPGSQGGWLGLFLLNLQGQASGRQLLIAHRPHSSSLPTASHIQTYRQSPLPFLQIGRLRGVRGMPTGFLYSFCFLESHPPWGSWSQSLPPHRVCGSFPTLQQHSRCLTPVSCHRQEDCLEERLT